MAKQITYKDFPEIAAYMEEYNIGWHSDEIRQFFDLSLATLELPTKHHPSDWQVEGEPNFIKLSIDEQILVN